MKICIVDDEQNCIDNLEGLLGEYGKNRGLPLEIHSFSKEADFKAAYAPDLYSVVFLDIYIGETTGMDLASHIRSLSENGMIIFCTTSLSDMPEAFRYHAFEYIIKPAEYSRIEKVMDDALLVLPKLEKYIDIASGSDRYTLALSTVISAVTSGHYLEIYVKDKDPLLVRLSLTAFLELLAGDERFLAVNKGILVNMDHIKSIQDKTCTMDSGQSFPIKVRTGAAIKKTWQDYQISKIRKGQNL